MIAHERLIVRSQLRNLPAEIEALQRAYDANADGRSGLRAQQRAEAVAYWQQFNAQTAAYAEQERRELEASAASSAAILPSPVGLWGWFPPLHRFRQWCLRFLGRVLGAFQSFFHLPAPSLPLHQRLSRGFRPRTTLRRPIAGLSSAGTPHTFRASASRCRPLRGLLGYAEFQRWVAMTAEVRDRRARELGVRLEERGVMVPTEAEAHAKIREETLERFANPAGIRRDYAIPRSPRGSQ